jgi:hypothetical protein
MRNLGTTSVAFQDFKDEMDGAFELADIIRRGGLQKLKEYQDFGNVLTQQLAGLDMGEFNRLSDKEKARYNSLASSEDTQKMGQLAQEVEVIVRSANKTVPHTLFIFLVTVFEAYLQNIATAIYQSDIALLDQAEGVQVAQRNQVARRSVAERVNRLFQGESLDYLADEIFTKSLNIPFVQICQAAKTSSTELDKAKALRNIHLHNSGRVDQKFKDRINDQSLVVGDYYPVTMDYLLEMKDKMYLPVLGVDTFVMKLYPGIPASS